ncbi:hypothetical protein [Empedobacter brevis]|uniref:hypothetical protein n=1 Tax=Empedobacter brevis TaxID=247 RepID=UPI0039B08DC2
MQTNLLIDVVKSYKQHGYSIEIRNAAIQILEERGIKMDQLELTGRIRNSKYEKAMLTYQKYNLYSIIALIFNIISIYFMINPSFLTYPFYIITLIFILLTFSSARTLSFILKDKSIDYSYVYIFVIFVGAILYFIIFFITRKQIKEAIKAIR